MQPAIDRFCFLTSLYFGSHVTTRWWFSRYFLHVDSDVNSKTDWDSRNVSNLHTIVALVGAFHTIYVEPLGFEFIGSSSAATFESSPLRDKYLMITAVLIRLWSLSR
jgi:hypothetical protein